MSCSLAYKTARLQFVTGSPTSEIVTDLPAGSYVLPDAGGSQVLFNLYVVDNSIEVYSEGSIMPRAILDQQSYTVVYNSTQSLIEFYTGPEDPGLAGDVMIIVRLNYLVQI